MANQLINRSKMIVYECLIWGISLWMGGITALALIFRIADFIDYSRPVRISITLFGILTLTIIFNSLLLKFLDNLNTQNRLVLFSCLMVSIFLVLTLWLLGKIPVPVSTIPQSWLGGNGELIIWIASLLLTVVFFPFLLFLVALELWALFHLDHLQCYHRLFFAALIGLLLLPLCESPDLSNIRNNFWGREELLDIYANSRYHLGDQIFSLSIIGRDNWLVFIGDDYQNAKLFSQNELADIQRKLDRLNNLLRSKGIKLIVIAPPNKNTIYPEYMPPQIPVLGSQSRLDQLLAYQQQHGEFKVMDLRPVLLNARKERQLYYATDTHWNPYGVFIAYQEVFRELQKDFPSLKPHTLEEYRLVPGLQGYHDIARIEHLDIQEKSFDLELVTNRQITWQVWENKVNDNSFFDHDAAVVTTTQSDASLLRLLMFRDSFAVALIPFFSDHFSRAVYLWAVPKNESYYDTEKPDIVILEYTERYLDYLLNIPG